MQLVIVMEGGIVQGVVSQEAHPEIDVYVVDYDARKDQYGDDDNVLDIPQSTDETYKGVPAYVSMIEVCEAGIPVDYIARKYNEWVARS